MPQTFKISLKFDNDTKTINKENGLNIKELSELLRDLNGVLNPTDGVYISVSDISDNCYQPTLITNSQPTYNEALDLHRRIHSDRPSVLRSSEKKYAKTLKNILRKRNFILDILDNDNSVILSISPDEMDKEIEIFKAIKNVTGIITEIGGPKLDGGRTHIDVEGIGYQIFTTPEQDLDLSRFYRQKKLRLKIVQRVSIKNSKIISANLLEYKAVTDGNFFDNIRKLSLEDLSFLKGIEEDSIEELF